MAWSPHDPSLLLSAGKDARTICWDVSSAGGDIVCEYPASNPANWAFDVAWCPGVWLGMVAVWGVLRKVTFLRFVRGCGGIERSAFPRFVSECGGIGAL